jgi:methionine-rich copper-binding protein CopC
MTIQYGSVGAALLLSLLLSGPTPASAHAQLRSATPAAGASVDTAPAEVLVKFSEPLEASFSTVAVRDAVGKRVDKADAHLDPGDRTIIHVSLQPLAKGTYIVVWRALTADTHRTEGAFIFRVGKAQ